MEEYYPLQTPDNPIIKREETAVIFPWKEGEMEKLPTATQSYIKNKLLYNGPGGKVSPRSRLDMDPRMSIKIPIRLLGDQP